MTNWCLRRKAWEQELAFPFYKGSFRDTNTGYWLGSGRVAEASPRGHVEDLLGIHIVTPGSPWNALNLAFVSRPVTGLAELRLRLERAAAFYAALARAWTLVVCENWIAPELRDAVAALCGEISLRHSAHSFGMIGKRFPAAPASSLVIRAVADARTREDFVAVNAAAWAVPVEWIRDLLAPDAVWQDTRGYVGYSGDQPVSTAMRSLVQGSQYLSWFATHPAHRRRGYAEAIVRQIAAECPDSFLVASAMGAGIWERIGFRSVARFDYYVSASKTG